MTSPPSTGLPADIIKQLVISNYVLFGSTSVLIWDVLCHLSDDYELISRHRFTFPLLVYLVSRITNILLLIGWCVSGTALGIFDNFRVVEHVFNAIYAIAAPSSQMLFFLPIRAIWINCPRVVWLFTALWIATTASHLTPLIVLGVTDNFNSGSSSLYMTIPAIAAFVNDTLLCSALVWRILGTMHEAQYRWMWVTIPTGPSTPQIARALLYNGCGYYLFTLCITLPVIVMAYVTTLPFAYRTVPGFIAIMITNIMGSRVYRKTKLGHFSFGASATYASSEAPSRLMFASAGVSHVASDDVDSAADVERGAHSLPQGSLNDSSLENHHAVHSST